MAWHGEELEFNVREWTRKGHLTCENHCSRRFSASHIRSFREDHKSCTTNFTISSTVSSPGYSLREEIDPSNYSFTGALKALQAKTVYKNNWDWLKREGVELNSKWDEAEKYICNPLSGEVPLECLSSKTLNSRSFRNLSIMPTSSLMILPSNYNLNNPRTINTNVRFIHEDPPDHLLIQEKKIVGLKRDVGVQSAPENVCTAKTTPIMKRSMKRQVEADDPPVEDAVTLKAQQEEFLVRLHGAISPFTKIDYKHIKDVKLEEKEQKMMTNEMEEGKKKKRGSGCFSWIRRVQRKPRKSKCIFLICPPHLIKASNQ